MTEQINIAEVDEQGIAIEEEEIAADPPPTPHVNPWVVALWLLCGLCLLLAILGLLGSDYVWGVNGSTVVPTAMLLDNRPWFANLTPYTWLFIGMTFLIALATLIMHAVFWERRNRWTSH